jgi:hypothetical protein
VIEGSLQVRAPHRGDARDRRRCDVDGARRTRSTAARAGTPSLLDAR